MGDPELAAVQDVAAVDRLGAGRHGARVRPAVRLRQAEAADHLAAGHVGKPAPPLRLRSEGEDRVHDQRGLHAHGRAVAGIDRLDLPRDQAVGDVGGAGAAVLFGQGGAEQPQLAHFGHDLRIVAFLGEGRDDARQKALTGVVARRVGDQPLLLGEPALQVERVLPAEGLCGRA